MSRNGSRKQIVERAEEYLYEQGDRELVALQKALHRARRRWHRQASKQRKARPGDSSKTSESTFPDRVEAMHEAMARYAEAEGLCVPYLDFTSVVALPVRSRRTAAAYADAPILDPNASPAYRAFCDETARQFEFLTRPLARGGLGIEVVIWARDPYPGAAAMMAELRERGRLRVYATAACGNPHPYLSDYENDMFRAVHDAFGHAAIGRGFDEHGEEAAWLAHSHLYSPLARRALTTETRGQNCALIYGNHGDGFPVQKMALLPEQFSELHNVTILCGDLRNRK